MSSIQVTSNVVVHFDHDIGRYVSVAEDETKRQLWRFRSVHAGVMAELEADGHRSGWRFWPTREVARRSRDDSPWAESVRVAMLEASNGFPCLREAAEMAFDIATAGPERRRVRTHVRA